MNMRNERAVFLAWALALSGCSSDDPAGSQAGGPTNETPAPPPGSAAQRYGFGPDPAAGVTYQSDVVFVEGGPDAIRSASDDGLTWVLRGTAKGVSDLAPGKVLYASSRAAGRVLDVRPQGSDVAVTLGPVQLGEVIRNAQLHLANDVDLATIAIQEIPDLPGMRADLPPASSSKTTQAVKAASLRSANGASFGLAPLDLPPPFTEGSKAFSLSDWSGRMDRSSGNVTLHVEHVDEAGLKVLADIGFEFASPHLDSDLGLVDGDVGDSELRFRGLRRVTLDLAAGSANGLGDNQHLKFEIPVSLDAPVIIGGVAMNLNVRFKFLVDTAFSAKDSTLNASGAWTTDGPIGFDKTSGKVSLQKPTVTVEKSIIDSLDGISIGANGFVFATDIRIMLGLGIPAASAGPYGRLTTSVGLTVGSDLGIIKCRQATVVISSGGGVGISASDTVVSGINAILEKLGIPKKVEEDSGKDVVLEEVYNQTFTTPDKAICK